MAPLVLHVMHELNVATLLGEKPAPVLLSGNPWLAAQIWHVYNIPFLPELLMQCASLTRFFFASIQTSQ